MLGQLIHHSRHGKTYQKQQFTGPDTYLCSLLLLTWRERNTNDLYESFVTRGPRKLHLYWTDYL